MTPALLWALAIFTGALGLRLAYIVLSADFPTFVPGLDVAQYWEAARDLRSGARPSFALAASTAPGYSVWLAFWQSILGESVTAQRCVQAVVGSVRCSLIFACALRLGVRPWTAAVAALVHALLPAAIVFDTTLLKVCLETTLLTGAIAVVIGRKPESRGAQLVRGLGAGILLASLVLTQLLGAVVGLALVAALALGRERSFLSATVAGTVCLTAVLGIRLWHLQAGPADPFLPRAGFELAIAQQPLAQPCPDPAGFCTAGTIPATPDGHAFGARLGMSAKVGRMLRPASSDRIWRTEALRRIEGEPKKALWLASLKLAAALNDFERKDNDHIPLLQARVAPLGMDPVSFGWVVVGGMAGLAALITGGDRRAWLFAALVMASTTACLLGVVTARTRFPLTVPLSILTAVALDAFRGDARRQSLITATAVVAALLAFWPVRPEVVDEHMLRGLRNETVARMPLDEKDRVTRALQLDGLGRHREAEVLVVGHEQSDPRAAAIRIKYAMWLGDLERAKELWDGLSREMQLRMSQAFDAPTMAAVRQFLDHPSGR